MRIFVFFIAAFSINNGCNGFAKVKISGLDYRKESTDLNLKTFNASGGEIDDGVPFNRFVDPENTTAKDDSRNLDKKNSIDEKREGCPFIIREATEKDLPKSAAILTDSFFKEKTNFFTYPIQRLEVWLNLVGRFQTFRFSERTGARYRMLVACEKRGEGEEGIIVGCCEVDDCKPGGEVNAAPRPYMSNLAVREDFRRKGVAKAIITHCENVVLEDWEKSTLHLKLYSDNYAGKKLYDKCGYLEETKRSVDKDGKTVLILRKKLEKKNE